MVEKNFEHWPEIKKGIKFAYFTLEYDPDPEAVRDILSGRGQQIEEIILERFEPFWRDVFGPSGFASFTFPFRGVDVRARAFNNSSVCRIDLRSLSLDKKNDEITGMFFPVNLKPLELGRPGYLLKDVLDYAARHNLLPNFDFRVTNPRFSTDKLVDAIGTELDPKVKKLVELLNRLGIYTTASCEGHKDDGLPYPWLDFTLISLPKFLALVEQFKESEFKENIIDLFRGEFRVRPPKGTSLQKGQQSFLRLTRFLEENSPYTV